MNVEMDIGAMGSLLSPPIVSLSRFPNRCDIAPETEFLGQTLRHYIYKSHRIIFRVEEAAKIVRVLYVRHGAMEPIGKGEAGK